MEKFLEVAGADLDGAGKDYLVGSSHGRHALLLAAEVLSVGLIVTVRAVESFSICLILAGDTKEYQSSRKARTVMGLARRIPESL